jgi:hypothetical protein
MQFEQLKRREFITLLGGAAVRGVRAANTTDYRHAPRNNSACS